jgi:hypothetical protein
MSTFKQYLLSKKLLTWGISILDDIRPMVYKLSCCGSLWARYLLFKFVLGHCDAEHRKSLKKHKMSHLLIINGSIIFKGCKSSIFLSWLFSMKNWLGLRQLRRHSHGPPLLQQQKQHCCFQKNVASESVIQKIKSTRKCYRKH